MYGHRQHSTTNKQCAVINDAPQQNQLLYPLQLVSNKMKDYTETTTKSYLASISTKKLICHFLYHTTQYTFGINNAHTACWIGISAERQAVPQTKINP